MSEKSQNSNIQINKFNLGVSLGLSIEPEFTHIQFTAIVTNKNKFVSVNDMLSIKPVIFIKPN